MSPDIYSSTVCCQILFMSIEQCIHHEAELLQPYGIKGEIFYLNLEFACNNKKTVYWFSPIHLENDLNRAKMLFFLLFGFFMREGVCL